MNKVTEFEVRAIDLFGDCADVSGCYDSLEEAKNNVPNLDEQIVAWVIERRVRRFGLGKSDRFTICCAAGDNDALQAGGWMEVAS